jgi:glycosyltransferase involved in cell wall biosynthesis
MKLKSQKLCVLMPTYNKNLRILHSLMALERQTTKNFEVIISDDNSTDGTSEIIQNFLKCSSLQYQFFSQKSQLGALANFLFLMSKVNSEYFLFLDCEDHFSDNYFSSAYSRIADNPDVLVPNFYEYGENFRKRKMLAPERINNLPKNFRLPLLQSYTNLSGVSYFLYSIFRTEVLLKPIHSIFSTAQILKLKFAADDIAIALYIASKVEEIHYLNDVDLFHFSRLLVDESREILNKPGYEDFVAVTNPEIFFEAVSILENSELFSVEECESLREIITLKFRLVLAQRKLAKI